MTITRENLKVFKPELIGSSDDAGGQRTKNVVVSGKLNELFTAISDIDHAQSALDIAKCYPSLDTDDTSTLLGSHVFINEPPTDPLVNMLMVESTALNDESRMVEMKEILESSVTAGSLIRSGAPGFLPNQNSFSKDYLESTYVFNNKEYRKITTLRVGQVIAISVEYPGQEDATYPRFIHYCKVTDVNAPGNSQGNIVFDPPIDKATPEYDTVINTESGCTKLRLVNDASPLKYHGVSKLTVAANSTLLTVANTSQNLIPVVVSEKVNSGLSLGDQGDITLKTESQVATSAQTYLFNVNDVLQGGNDNVDYSVRLEYTSGGNSYNASNALITVANDSVSVTLSRVPDINTPVSIKYISTSQYSDYNNEGVTSGFPQNSVIIKGSVVGTAQPASATAYGIYEREDGLYALGSTTIRVGILDYSTGEVTLESGITSITYDALVKLPESATSVQFTLAVDEPVVDTFYVQVETLGGVIKSGNSDSSGVVAGTGVTGNIVNGLVNLTFTEAVKLSTLRYNITEVARTLPPADIYGLNPLRIPNEGVVSIYRVWGTVAVNHSQYQNVPSPTAGQTFTIRSGARFVDITDKNGATLWSATDDNYTVDFDAGTVTINSSFAGFTAPYVLTDTIGELGLVTEVTDNTVSLASPLTREFPIGATVSSVQILDDLQARVGKIRDMTSWSGNWDLDGDTANGNLNTVDHPIEVVNNAAVNEDWVLVFTSETAFKCLGRRIGQVGTGDTINDFAPINTVTQIPYFTIRKEAFGGGWSAGEAIRFETFASSKPIMALRTVEAGHSQITTDRAVLSFRGNES